MTLWHGGPILRNPTRLPDDRLFTLGTDRDNVLVHRAATLAANTALTDVLVGTVVGQALAANSLILSNITASGDIALYWNRGGNSEQFLFGEGDTGIVWLAGNAGGIMLGLAAGPPAPDVGAVHIWDGTAGTVTATTGTVLVLEGSGGEIALSFLTPNTSNGSIYFGDPESATIGFITYGHTANSMEFQSDGAVRLTIRSTGLRLQGGLLLLSGSATPIGIQTTNTALTVGSLGTIVIPLKTTTGEPTDAQIGNLSGSILWNEFDNTLNVRDTTVDNPLTVTLTGYLIQSYVPREQAVGAWYHPAQVWAGEEWGDGREVVDETRCPVCGEDIVPQAGPVVFWPNAYRPGSNRHPERLDVHAIFGHLHPERESYIQQLERRVADLEQKAA